MQIYIHCIIYCYPKEIPDAKIYTVTPTHLTWLELLQKCVDSYLQRGRT